MDYQKLVDGRFAQLQNRFKEAGVIDFNLYPLGYSRVRLLIGSSDIVLTYDQITDILLNDQEVHNYTVNSRYTLGMGR